MIESKSSATERTTTRADRGLSLYRDKRGAFERISREREEYIIPSCTERYVEYRVSLATGECSCPDHQRNGVLCKHYWAAVHYRRWIKGAASRMLAFLDCQADEYWYEGKRS